MSSKLSKSSLICKHLSPYDICRLAQSIYEEVDWVSKLNKKTIKGYRDTLAYLESQYKEKTGRDIKYKN